MKIINVRQMTYRSFMDVECCCDSMRDAWSKGVVSAPYATNSQLCIDKQCYSSGIMGHEYSHPLKLCPWCGTTITYSEETRRKPDDFS